MSGHSKWANIKQRKGKMDAVKGNVFTKIGREIAVAVKQGGPDPASNSRLRDAIAKAKQNNMPSDNINRSIKKASGALDGANYEDMVYEGYAAGGVAVIVEALTDNKTRTAGDVRHLFDKYGGALGATGCVSYSFKKKGVIIIDKSYDEDEVFMVALENGADDVVTEDDSYEVYTQPQALDQVKAAFEEAKISVLDASVDLIPDMYIDPPADKIPSIKKMLDLLEENDDVQNVYHNANLPEEEDED